MEKSMLKRELQREALLRLESAARTESDFLAVTEIWNKLDENRMRRERYSEICCPLETMERAPSPTEDMLDIVLDHVDWFHHLLEDTDVSKQVLCLTAKQKDVLFLNQMRMYPVWYIAWMKNQSERNIRKIRALLYQRIRDRLLVRFLCRLESGPPLTNAMLWFMDKA